MMELPEGLAPWAWQLNALPRAVAMELGPWMSRLDALLGPLLPTDDHTLGGQPDGYRGVSQRGPYERLLLSQWVLADAEPDEFLRRAVMGEHLFLELERTQERAGRRCVALFDLSPWQMGAPRVAHAALLAALDKRARQHGVPMLWGVIQDAAHQLTDGDAEALPSLIQRRAHCGDTLGGLAAWGAALSDEEACPILPHDEVWWVGGRALLEAEPWPSLRARLVIEPVRQAEARSLEVALHPRQGPARRLKLALPQEAQCLRLLRAQARASSQSACPNDMRVDPRGGLHFSPDGRRLLVRHPNGAAIALHLPNSPREATGHLKWLRPGEGDRLVALGWHKRRFLSLHLCEGALWLEGACLSPNGHRVRWDASALAELGFAAPSPDQPLGACQFLGEDLYGVRVLVQGANGHLFEVTTQRHETVAACRRVTTGQVRGYAPVGERNAHYCYALMSEQAGAPCLSLYSDRDPDQPVVTEEGAYALVMGSGFYVLANRPAGWGVRVGALDWRLHGHKGARDVRVPSGTVVGLAFAVGVSMAPSLVVLEEDRCALRLIWAEGEREVARSDEPFVSVVVNTASRSMIACLTQSGAVQVYELSQGYGLLATYQNDAGAP